MMKTNLIDNQHLGINVLINKLTELSPNYKQDENREIIMAGG